MKKLASVFGLLAVAAATSVASADHHMPAPAPAGVRELYRCVKVEDCDKIAPCAVSMIVEIPDPCWRPDPCNPCCKPGCVLVEICVPAPRCCDRGPKVTCSKDGRYKKFDFGKYRVEITTKSNGWVVVDYDD